LRPSPLQQHASDVSKGDGYKAGQPHHAAPHPSSEASDLCVGSAVYIFSHKLGGQVVATVTQIQGSRITVRYGGGLTKTGTLEQLQAPDGCIGSAMNIFSSTLGGQVVATVTQVQGSQITVTYGGGLTKTGTLEQLTAPHVCVGSAVNIFSSTFGGQVVATVTQVEGSQITVTYGAGHTKTGTLEQLQAGLHTH